ncbi:MAG TPA: type II toxin-antitoxin system VapC family toxin [Planctomycetaceae bacterium]|nr:type II toxin-antitoxin system VapC family toxin [Planctomycetaceae bacterium]
MSLYLFDTDLLTLFREGHPVVCARAAVHSADELATSIVTVEEQLTGWYTLLRQAKNDQRLTAAYERLTGTVRFFSRMQILSFTMAAAARLVAFRKARLKIGTLDLRIACVALEAQAILVTRNRVDFDLVPGLVIEDWSVA